MKATTKRILESPPFRQLQNEAERLDAGKPLYLTGISGSLLAFVTSFLFEHRQSQMLIAVPEKDQAEQLRDDLALLVGEERVHLVVHATHHDAKLLDMTAPIAQVEALRALASGESVIVVASAEGIVQPLPHPTRLSQRTKMLEQGKDYPFEGLLQQLEEFGFERKDFVEGYGDLAVRGGILDVFPYVGEHPVRVEFWGDTIESIREFDVLSQRSIRTLHSASIVANLADFHNEHSTKTSLLDYLDANALLFLDQPELIEREIEEFFKEGVTNIFDWQTLEEQFSTRARIVHSMMHPSTATVVFSSTPQPPVNGKIKLLIEQIRRLGQKGYDILITCDTKNEATRIEELIGEELEQPVEPAGEEDMNVSPRHPLSYRIIPEALHNGFIYDASRIALFTEHEIFGRLKRRALGKRKAFRGISQKELHQLRRGDFVVHHDFGVGKFSGLQKIKVSSAEQEVMKLEYAENDVVYVNLNFVNRVQKYASQEGHIPQLMKLGTPQWDRLKARAKKRIKDIARDLINVYARRKHEPGFAFSPDTHWQKEMEASFMFEDTPDQAQATNDVKQDMESPAPMERLVCGDVGFGKTEVAVRAAFKAVMDGKQAAVLVPTTILAAQHFNTFMDRLGRYAVKIASLTRFKTPKEQKQILNQLKEGHVDILIGTHRMLSKDVEFKHLGLLVIDEEHRFGVSAKEKLRQLRTTVDTLTLTATPIPRTLQFSLLGARDLSIINTPPRNRLPIVSEIAQFDLKLIREAILKEMHRGGQVYFIHDRIETMDAIQAMLSEHVPEARFHIAHGQMAGHELERTMMAFLDRKYDVLLCTKIIESGIDIPSVNTIIINRADRFGLAELYQLRGRVGRSNVQAYAYLLTPPLSVLPRHALRRLQAIQEFTELGSGFNLAMRDLEIRGAGNLLGGEQSGFVMEMGFEMYQKIVEEAVRELKEQEFQEVFAKDTVERKRQEVETVVETDIEAFIPDFYVESDAERLDVYRRLYRAAHLSDVQAMREDLRDRFGEYPEEVENLFATVEVKVLASMSGFSKVELHGSEITLSFPRAADTAFYEQNNGRESPFQRIIDLLPQLPGYSPRLRQEKERLILRGRLKEASDPQGRLKELHDLLIHLRNEVVPQAEESTL